MTTPFLAYLLEMSPFRRESNIATRQAWRTDGVGSS